MGNLLDRSETANNTVANEIVNNVPVANRETFKKFLNKYTKQELINHVKTLQTKKLNLTDFTTKMKDIDLETKDLIPMCFELYEKMMETLGEYKPPADNNNKPKGKKLFFVRPRFGVDQVNTANNVVVTKRTLTFTNLMLIPNPNTQMKTVDITLDEYTNSFNNTTTKKDMMGINKGMLRDLPQYLKQRYVNVYNKILSNNTLINGHSFGKGSYIYKAAKKGPRDQISSFRMIVSIPNAVNHLHRILALRLNDFILQNKYIDTTIQKGGISGQKFAIFEQYFKIKNVVKHANQNNKSCVMLFLDITNAYGSLNLDNLYKVLENYHVDKKLISYLREFYGNFEYYVDIQNTKTSTFKWQDGLIQGCSLSPVLFVLALNYVLDYMNKNYCKEYGYDIDGTNKILFTAYMDDICIICKDTQSLNIIYPKLLELLKTLGLERNKDKCATMFVNSSSDNLQGELAEINKVNVFKYLGEYISNDGKNIESYKQFIKMLARKLKSIDAKSVWPDQYKIQVFNTCVLGWAQRKALTLYDLSQTNRLKIIAIIKEYLTKWNYTGDINIFSTVNSIVSNSTDGIITKVEFKDEDFDDDLENNIEIANYVLRDANVKLEYSQIDDNFELELDTDLDLDEYNDEKERDIIV